MYLYSESVRQGIQAKWSFRKRQLVQRSYCIRAFVQRNSHHDLLINLFKRR